MQSLGVMCFCLFPTRIPIALMELWHHLIGTPFHLIVTHSVVNDDFQQWTFNLFCSVFLRTGTIIK